MHFTIKKTIAFSPVIDKILKCLMNLEKRYFKIEKQYGI